MKYRKPTDDPNVQIILVTVYDVIRERVKDPTELPLIGEVRVGVDSRLEQLPREVHIKTDLSPKLTPTMNLIKAAVRAAFYLKYGTILPMN